MKQSRSFLVSLFGMFATVALAQALPDGWSRAEAEAKLGVRVQCVRNPDDRLLQWGPNFPGWDRGRQPKALGRPLMVGTQGVISEIMPVSNGKYGVVVGWDAEKVDGPFWTTVIGPAELNVTAVSLRPSDLVGRWREVGRSATLEFLADGVFKTVDNEGMAVGGIFSLVGDGKLSFATRHEGTEGEVVSLDFSLIGDELTLAPAAGGRPERYQRQR